MGMANTNQIYNRLTFAGSALTSAYAAGIAWAYTNNGKSDWHLPSRNELNELRQQAESVGGFVATSYWSSSEYYDRYYASVQAFLGSAQFFQVKEARTYGVRPVRAFGPSCADGGACVVGDTGPGGGIVFYVHDDADDLFTSTGSDCGTSCKYMEAAPFSGQVSLTWSTGANQSLAVSGADARGIGNGFQNTVDIVNQSGNNSDTSAAVYANSYSNNGKNDWYLPSVDELNQMCRWVRNQAASDGACTGAGNANTGPGASGFTGEYWSSTEDSHDLAHMQTMDYADRYGEVKFGARMVRPIRAFG
jgi:hypothetical protein